VPFTFAKDRFTKIVVVVLLAFGLSVFVRVAQAENPTDFEVKSAFDDSTFQLSEQKGKFVVLHFLLKTECP
jgi:thioredoxin-dependent peroxiredoxin